MLETSTLQLLQQMCIDGEARCDARACSEAIENKNHGAAAYYFQLKERYTRLKAEIGREPARHDTASVIRQIIELLNAEAER